MHPAFKPSAAVFTHPMVYLGVLVLALSGCGAIDEGASGGNNASSSAMQVEHVTNGPAPVPKWLDGTQAQTDVAIPEAVLQADAQLRLLMPAKAEKSGQPPKADLATQHVRAMADFNGDGRADVLWQTDTGATYITTMLETTARCPAVSLGTETDTVMGTGDFNGDGKADIVWRNMSTGAVRISLIDVAGGGAPSNVVGIKTGLSVGTSPIALHVKLEGIGDFDGNGRADMLWRNRTTGRSVLSYHDATGAVTSWPQVSPFIDPVSTVAFAVGDFNGDGKSDIVWRNLATGNVVLSLMNGNVATWRGITAAPIAMSVAIEAVGDFDNNGRADILWRNRSTGRSVMSYHNTAGGIASWPVVSEFIDPANTSAVAVGDTDGDGKTDILWRNLATGNSVLSKMNGNVPTWNAASFSVCSSVSSTKLPHSGTAANQCFKGNSHDLVPCNRKSVMQLYNQQDGHRISITPMNYSAVGSYPLTSCVKDNVTGLIWEGKEASGPRAGSNNYSNYDSTTQGQIWNGTRYVTPTQADIDAATNSVGYKNFVNNASLCGYTDWRLPTVDELETLVDASKPDPGPTIDATWFPNTQGSYYWSSVTSVEYFPSNVSSGVWYVSFSDGTVDAKERASGYTHVRLVRIDQ
jgi:Protein of unknown function (DUF1566)/FG-GAP-like repeat/FG-GAP repeat